MEADIIINVILGVAIYNMVIKTFAVSMLELFLKNRKVNKAIEEEVKKRKTFKERVEDLAEEKGVEIPK